jgi:peptide deformylase
MSLQTILTNPNEFLRQKSAALSVEEITSDETQTLIDDMIETMHTENGIGLAAPQIGVNKRIIVATFDKEDHVLINPVLKSKSLRTIITEEGCLSIPGVFGMVKRYRRINIEAYNREGEKIEMKLEGMPSVIFQHEVDHLDGVLFIDKAETIKNTASL